MGIQDIITPALSLASLGLLFGILLAIASKIFFVKVDPLIEKVEEALPGVNCGACGKPGCSSFAKAVVEEGAPIDGCPVGGADVASKLGELMGVEVASGEKMVAKILCNTDNTMSKKDFDYVGIKDCKAASKFEGGEKGCKYGCLGLGTCVEVCPFDAIYINKKGNANVIKEKCVSCEKCVAVCPKGIIDMIPESSNAIVSCKTQDRGKTVKENCDVGCIGCKICYKSCPFDAIEFDNNLAKVNYEKCRNCYVCVEKCPTRTIEGDINKRKKAEILQDKCIKCNICKKACPVDAITGEVREKHEVIKEKCIGCNVCLEKCPKDAIEIK